MTNTTTTQDREIKDAESNNHIQNLIDIIGYLDGIIEQWKSAASEFGCNDPDELRAKIASLPETY